MAQAVTLRENPAAKCDFEWVVSKWPVRAEVVFLWPYTEKKYNNKS